MDYKYPTPQLLFKAICNAIRSKTGNSDEIPHQNIPDELDSIMTEEEYNIEMQRFIDIIEGTSFINDRITTVKNMLFDGCASLATIDLPECTSIGSMAFRNCTSLTTVDLPECTSIGNSAFSSCTSLATVDLPECTSIREYAFRSCTSLTTVNLPKCTSIDRYVFSECTNLTTVNLPKCTSIREYAFSECTSLTTIDLPKCTSIRGYAFNSCTSLTTVNLPECTSIGECAFDFTNLTTVILGSDTLVALNSSLGNTPIGSGFGHIYVPSNLVDEYKSSDDWYVYRYIIASIEYLPSNLKEKYGYD